MMTAVVKTGLFAYSETAYLWANVVLEDRVTMASFVKKTNVFPDQSATPTDPVMAPPDVLMVGA